MKKYGSRITLVILLLVVANLACSSANVLPGLFATATPTFTNTPTITPTFTPSPTSTSTPTPTLTPTPTPLPTGVSITEKPGGGMSVTDYDAGYTLEISADWLVVPTTMEDLQKMSQGLQASNPDLAKAMKNMQAVGNDALRLMALNQNKATQSGTMITNVNIVIQQEAMILALPLDFFLDLNVEQIKAALPSAKVLSSSISKNANGLEIGIIEIELKANTTVGNSVTAYEKIVFVKTGTAMCVFTFAGPNALRETLVPRFDEVIDTIQLLEP
ncbi:MAG: hypothetical protein ACOY0R_20225 [Chloroflexota bacterium]